MKKEGIIIMKVFRFIFGIFLVERKRRGKINGLINQIASLVPENFCHDTSSSGVI